MLLRGFPTRLVRYTPCVDGFDYSVGAVSIPMGKEVEVSMARRETIPSFKSAFIAVVRSLICLFLLVQGGRCGRM